jgi:hypothetical protein
VRLAKDDDTVVLELLKDVLDRREAVRGKQAASGEAAGAPRSRRAARSHARRPRARDVVVDKGLSFQ